MSIPPIAGVTGITAPSQAAAATAPAQGFGSSIADALQAVSDAERVADANAADVATGGDTSIQELMVSMTKAQLSVDLLVQVRNKAIEAYQEVMRMQV